MSRNDALLKAFAAELKARRCKAGLSQEALAYRADVNRTYIAKLELAKNQPTLCVLQDLAKALNNKLPELLEAVLLRYAQRPRRMTMMASDNSHSEHQPKANEAQPTGTVDSLYLKIISQVINGEKQ